MVRQSCAVTVAVLATLSATPAYASSQERGSFTVSSVVPRVCGIEAGDFTVDNGTNSIRGTVQEYCNGGGFQVFANHRRLDEGESAEIEYDGIKSPIQMSGMTFVALRSGARFRNVSVVIHQQDLDAELSVSLSITAV